MELWPPSAPGEMVIFDKANLDFAHPLIFSTEAFF
jgi:hypothetical protein